MPKLELDQVPASNRTGYPPDLAGPVAGRFYRRVGAAAGIEDFGASHVTLAPGAWSSQRHWHEDEDELVVVLSGEVVLIDDGGEAVLRAGDLAVFPKGDGNGHHLVNRSAADAVLVAVGRPARGVCHYPDVDLHLEGGKFFRKDGTPT
jgi:uncharacterized cupin superfamily protein